MAKNYLSRPVFIMLYGYPGAGKTYFARQLAEDLGAAHVQADRIRFELFEEPRYNKHENDIVDHLTDYMTEEFLKAGVSVVYDSNAARSSQRRALREMARKNKTEVITIWIQIDVESSFARVAKRDRRKTDEKYGQHLDRTTFDQVAARMQNPSNTEEYVVISGKHHYQTQRGAVMRKLTELGILSPQTDPKMVKPELVNLVPQRVAAGRVDTSRRNIVIR